MKEETLKILFVAFVILLIMAVVLQFAFEMGILYDIGISPYPQQKSCYPHCPTIPLEYSLSLIPISIMLSFVIVKGWGYMSKEK